MPNNPARLIAIPDCSSGPLACCCGIAIECGVVHDEQQYAIHECGVVHDEQQYAIHRGKGSYSSRFTYSLASHSKQLLNIFTYD